MSLKRNFTASEENMQSWFISFNDYLRIVIIITESEIFKLKTILLIQKELYSNESLPRSGENEAIQAD